MEKHINIVFKLLKHVIYYLVNVMYYIECKMSIYFI